jgi:hypothetical protein
MPDRITSKYPVQERDIVGSPARKEKMKKQTNHTYKTSPYVVGGKAYATQAPVQLGGEHQKFDKLGTLKRAKRRPSQEWQAF